MKNYITAEQFDQLPIAMVLVKGCINCDYYEAQALSLNIPILKLEHANYAPFTIIEPNGVVYSPALWIDGCKTVSPSDLLLEMVSKYLQEIDEEA